MVDIASIALDIAFVHRIESTVKKILRGLNEDLKCPGFGASLHCSKAVIAMKRIARATNRIGGAGIPPLCLRGVAAL